MKDKNNTTTFKLWEVIIITLVSSLIMSLSTGYVVFRSRGSSPATNSKELNEFITTYNNIISNYYDDIDESALVDAAINGMLKYLGDPYTTYLNENNTSLLTDSLKGTYEGIGVRVTTNEKGEIVIIDVFDDTPASKAGLASNDIIIKINDEDLTDKTSNDAVDIIRNSQKIVLEVKRGEEVLSFNDEKKSLNIPIKKEI